MPLSSHAGGYFRLRTFSRRRHCLAHDIGTSATHVSVVEDPIVEVLGRKNLSPCRQQARHSEGASTRCLGNDDEPSRHHVASSSDRGLRWLAALTKLIMPRRKPKERNLTLRPEPTTISVGFSHCPCAWD